MTSYHKATAQDRRADIPFVFMDESGKKDEVRLPVLHTLEGLLGQSINGNMTLNALNYFSVWLVKLKRPGHGQETQPQPSAASL